MDGNSAPSLPSSRQKGLQLAEGRLGPVQIGLVQHHQIGIPQQLVLLQLHSAAVLAGLHIDQQVGPQRLQVETGLAGPRRLHQDAVVTGRAETPAIAGRAGLSGA